MFSNNLIETVLEDVQFPVYRIRFPAITLCNTNRINWNRIEEAKAKFLPQNRSQNTENLFENFMAMFENYRFGFFANFSTKFENESLTELDQINLNEVLEFLMFRCEEMFSTNSCLWRNKEFNCCDEFDLQKTVYGHCFTFNSEITTNGRAKFNDISYPRRSPGGGPGSGLRVQVNLHPDKKRPGNTQANGLQIICHKSTIWPTGQGVSFSSTAIARTETVVVLQPEIYVADKKISKLHLDQRGCLFEDEKEDNIYEYLPGQQYSFGNCLFQCKLRYAQEKCGCIPDMSFPAGNKTKRPCRASDFKCLGENDSNFCLKCFEMVSYYIRSLICVIVGIFKQFALKGFQADVPDTAFMYCRCAFTCTKTDYHGKRQYYL
ncbi:pickpocket protein 19-like [Condylostylus longicornis]|uniref:pickpocket protein 19-like n=1 Tax=Condylostylus longicornis TaxID=2530218 RepID=UPI00244DBD79|nr:pickpocket protein 19-like [Condylostylus longicornis]